MNDFFELTARGKLSDELRQLWRQRKGTEPDDDQISEALDETKRESRDIPSWLNAATERLGLER